MRWVSALSIVCRRYGLNSGAGGTIILAVGIDLYMVGGWQSFILKE
jgi:hypothetical protein